MLKIRYRAIRTVVLLLIAVLISINPAGAQGVEYRGTAYAGSLIKNINFADTARHWAKSSIARVAAMAVMVGERGRFFPDRPVTREEAVAALVRLSGMEAASTSGGKAGTENFQSSDWARDYIKAAARAGLLDQTELSGMDFRARVSRQEVFTWAGRALKIEPLKGSDVLKAAAFADYGEIDNRRLPYIAALAGKGIASGWNGRFYPNKTMTRGELAALLDRLKAGIPGGVIVKRGWVSSIAAMPPYTVYAVRTEDGPVYDLKAIRGEIDFPVIKSGVVYDSRALAEGDYVLLALRHDEVLFAEVTGAGRQAVSGELMGTEGDRIYIKDPRGNVHSFRLAAYPEVYVDGKKSSFSDLLPGVEVSAAAMNGTVYRLDVSSGRDDFGMPAARGPVEGTVKEVREKDGWYEVTVGVPGQGETKISLAPDTAVVKNGAAAEPGEIRPGDRIVAYFGPQSQTAPERVKVASGGRVNKIVRGRLVEGIPGEGIVLSDVMEFYFGTFFKKAGIMKVNLSKDTEVYTGAGAATPEDLIANYTGREIYAALNEEYGVKKAVKILVKSGDEYVANGPIDEVRWSTGEIEVGDVEALFDGLTISVLRGTSVYPDYLEEDREVFIVVNRSGSASKAAILYQPEFYDKSFEVLKGQIYEITRDGLVIRYRSVLEGSLWSSGSKSNKYEYSLADDVRIIDATGSSPKEISRQDFLKDRYIENYYYRSAYMISRGDKILAMIIKQGGRDDDTVSLGTIEAVADDGSRVTLANMLDYSQFGERWNTELPDRLELDMSGALVMERGEAAEKHNLRPGQLLYVIRENNAGLLAFVFEF